MTIITATLIKDTTKAYALKARSRKLLTAEQNAVLEDAGNGYPIDVIAFRKAATAALSAASTRAGQSMTRRQWAKEARHLLYWADAIIDQHVEGLPVYEPGARSPRIAELEAEVARLKDEGHSAEVTTSLRRAAVEVDMLRRAIIRAQELTRDAYARVDLERERRQQVYTDLVEAEKERDVLASVLLYAQTKSTDREFIARLLGYWDGLQDA